MLSLKDYFMLILGGARGNIGITEFSNGDKNKILNLSSFNALKN
jgi:hypothetical protein